MAQSKIISMSLVTISKVLENKGFLSELLFDSILIKSFLNGQWLDSKQFLKYLKKTENIVAIKVFNCSLHIESTVRGFLNAATCKYF